MTQCEAKIITTRPPKLWIPFSYAKNLSTGEVGHYIGFMALSDAIESGRGPVKVNRGQCNHEPNARRLGT